MMNRNRCGLRLLVLAGVGHPQTNRQHHVASQSISSLRLAVEEGGRPSQSGRASPRKSLAKGDFTDIKDFGVAYRKLQSQLLR